jgi:hypothetical protein
MAQATKNLPNLDLSIFPRYPGVAYALAHLAARGAVERELRAEGRRAHNSEIIALTQAYRAEHLDELLARAAEAVQRHTTLRAYAEREERELERQRPEVVGKS